MAVVLIHEVEDADALALAAFLRERGARTLTFPLGGPEADYTVDIGLDGFRFQAGTAVLTDEDLLSAELIVYRRFSSRNPSPVTVAGLAGDSRRFAEREWAAAIQGALVATEWAHPDRPWCNRPSLDGILRNKVALLASARKAGLVVPDLRIGNHTPLPRGDRFVVKAVNADEFIADDQKFTTAEFPAELVERFHGRRVRAPTLVQARVNHQYEVRCFVVGTSVLAYRIDAGGDEVDSRLVPADQLGVEPMELGAATAERLLAWARARGLLYCAFDLLVDRTGAHLLIDVNPHGGWGWYSVAQPAVARDVNATFLALAGNG
jgi:hypothetical protein